MTEREEDYPRFPLPMERPEDALIEYVANIDATLKCMDGKLDRIANALEAWLKIYNPEASR